MAGIKSAGQQLPPPGAPAFFIMQDQIIKLIKKKKPLDRLDDWFVKDFLDEFLRRNLKLNKKFNEEKLKKSEIKLIVKKIRNELNKIYGQFWFNSLSLKGHKSTKERAGFYSSVYKKIFSVTGSAKKVLDLGCGLNPLTYELIPDYKNIYFYAVELTSYDCSNIKKIFADKNIMGEVIKADLRSFNDFPDADVCFMFKLLEGIETKGHKTAEHLLKNIKTKYYIASFSTFNTSGKKMNYPNRGWFERLLKRLGFNFTKFFETNEVFY